MLRKCVLLLCVGLAQPAVASAQGIHQVSQIQNNAVVQRESTVYITAEYDDTPVAVALKDVARKGGVRVSFLNMVLEGSGAVTLTLNRTPLHDAFTKVLRGTNLKATKVAEGEWTVTREKPIQKQVGNGVISGRITDAKTGRAVPRALIEIVELAGTASDEDGRYRLQRIPSGTHTVVVRLVGYAKQVRQVTIGDGGTGTADFRLEPSINVLDQMIVTGTAVATELKAVPNAITVITAKQIEERGITRIDQLFRGEIPGLFAQNQGSNALLDEVTMYSRGATSLQGLPNVTSGNLTNTIKTYVDGVEMADSRYLSQIDPKSIERIEILTGPQASTIYGSNAINGVMQVFTKRGVTSRPIVTLSLLSGWVENNFSNARTPEHDYNAQMSGLEGRISYNVGGSWNYMGPWTPAKQLSRLGGNGGIRFDMSAAAGKLTADISARRAISKNVQRGTTEQGFVAVRETGLRSQTFLSTNLFSKPTTHTLEGQTFGLTVSYAPASWWSHEAGLGRDASDVESLVTGRGYSTRSDTVLSVDRSRIDRRSLHYTTTVRVPVSSIVQGNITAGTDTWNELSTVLNATTSTLTGTLNGTTTASRLPAHNTGAFLQSQVGVMDRLFFTYGLRAEWNPNYGAEALPNYTPRYGVAYTHELGNLTMKLRGSYGRSTRPPQPDYKSSLTIAEAYGPSLWASVSSLYLPYYGGMFDNTLANPGLTPEYQQGAEGGMELYFGSVGSIVLTRYNQTVDQLIALVTVDSVRTLTPCAATFECDFHRSDDLGYGYFYQNEFINVGSIRNQGWEAQGTLRLGPVSTRGTYSWTKSRSLGVNPKYLGEFPALSYPQYQPGATFQLLPEHTWALGATYSTARSSLAVNINGIGQAINNTNDLAIKHLFGSTRLPQNLYRMNIAEAGYVSFNRNYALADIIASHRLTPRIEALLQVNNLADLYVNDYSAAYATMGRQAKIGARIR